MTFFQTKTCQCCGEEEYMDSRYDICVSCKTELKKQQKLDWLAEKQSKTIEERIAFIENLIYDKFISKEEKHNERLRF